MSYGVEVYYKLMFFKHYSSVLLRSISSYIYINLLVLSEGTISSKINALWSVRN
jgi:hypothetical protein